jgi:hypothetical protein
MFMLLTFTSNNPCFTSSGGGIIIIIIIISSSSSSSSSGTMKWALWISKKVKLSLCLTKHHAMMAYWWVEL